MVYPLITLYSAGETKFETNGLGSLGEATSCKVTEEANGQFELEMNYPVHGRRFKDLELRRIIYTKPNPVDPPQGFRIYEITKPMNGIVTVYAAHLRYDLTGYPVTSFEASTCSTALIGLKEHSLIEHPFTFWTDKETTADFSVATPLSTTSALGGTEGSILDVYGGEYKFDNFTVRLYNHRGLDRGVSIRYGKNLTDLKQEENCSSVYTHVFPYWESEDSMVTVTEPIKTDGDYDFVNVLILDLSSEFEDPPYEEDLIEVATEYIKENDLGKPTVSLTVSFAQLEQTEEYKDVALLERVELFDTVSVEFPELGVSATAKVNQTVYNPLTSRYESVSLGDIRANISDTIIAQDAYVDEAIDETKSFLERSSERATNWITNGKGYMVAVRDEGGNWKEICSLDTPDINSAINVWRWNNGGFGFSSNGYNGPYKLAMTQDGHINADFIDVGSLTANIIKTGILNADLIRAGVLSSVDEETFYLDLVQGILRMKATELTITGKTVNEISQEIAESQFNEGIGNFITQTYDPKIADLQKQIDGQIENYFYDYDPALNNAPASNWKTEADYQKHEGDIFYNRSKGYAYRFFKDGNTWKWQLIQDTDITKALDAAAAAQDTADHKRRVFVRTPNPPYDVGDLWVQGEHGDILRCQNSKSENASYSYGDWILASKYTDDSALTEFIDDIYTVKVNELQQQADKKAETWYQSTNPANSWTSSERSEHVGDLWYNTSDQKTYIYNGSGWDETKTTPPDSVFDRIDGKAQIFIETPTVPYRKGDLWFNSNTSDIMTCIKDRLSGGYTSTDWEKRNKYTDDSELTDFIQNTYEKEIDELQQQADKKAETWYQSTNPANSWTSSERSEHVGDLWYNTSDQKTYIYSGSTWVEPKTEVPQEVFDKIDGKAQIFTSTPTVPYHKGDLWFNSTSSDIKVCTYTRTSGYYISSDWSKRDHYIDSSTATSAANTAVSNAMTTDNIFNALTNNGDKQGLYIGTDGNFYFNASYIKTGSLSADLIKSGTLDASLIDASKLTATKLRSEYGYYWTEISGARHSGGYTYGSTSRAGYLDLTTQTGVVGGSTYNVSLRSANCGITVWSEQDIILYCSTSGSHIYIQRNGARSNIVGSRDGNGGEGYVNYFYLSNSSKYLAFYESGGSNFFIALTSSDARLKKNIWETDVRALDAINAIGHCSFDRGEEHTSCGYIAQQLQEINPEFIIAAPNKDKDDNETNEYILHVNDFAILGYATKAIQELSEENDALKARCESLEQRVEKLEQLVQTLIH